MATHYMYYVVNEKHPLFTFDGEKMPEPDQPDASWGNPGRGYLEKTEQLVQSTRNADGQVVSRKINRRLRKFDNLSWPILTRNQVTWLKRKVANFEVQLGYYDDEDDAWVERRFYFGDMECEPIEWESVDRGPFALPRYIKRPTVYRNVKVNIIDMRVLIYNITRRELIMLEQKYLDVKTRNESYIDLFMLVQDTNIRITNVSSNDLLSYSDISSIIDLDRYTSETMATLEENEWILDGAFYNPETGRLYDGYVSNSMSDDNGDFEINPTITLDLLQGYKTEYFSIVFNPSVKSAYPKQLIIKFLNNSEQVGSQTINLDEVDTLPNLVIETGLGETLVNQVQLEFVGTQVRHRRIRVSTLMFGKLQMFSQDQLVSDDWTDKTSFVADSIPSRTFSFQLVNYDKQYNIDNPDNKLPIMNRNTEVVLRWGYNIAGYNEETGENENYGNNVQIEWTDFKHLRLLGVSTTDDGLVEFECGSVLDMMEDIYDRDVFVSNRTVRNIVSDLLDFSGVSSDTVIYDGDFGDFVIDVPLPEAPVRELIQLCAFACGATLMILDNGKIRFADISLTNPQIKQLYDFSGFITEPRAEQLEHTSNISLKAYHSEIENDVTSITTQTVYTREVDITYQATYGPTATIISGNGQIVSGMYYATRCHLVLNLPDDNGVEIEITGRRINTIETPDKSVTNDTLILDSQLMKEDTNGEIKQKYIEWYDKRFKYIVTTRGEPLINAGDFIQIQTPFTQVQNNQVINPKTVYVLQQNMSFCEGWQGDMEVIVL